MCFHHTVTVPALDSQIPTPHPHSAHLQSHMLNISFSPILFEAHLLLYLFTAIYIIKIINKIIGGGARTHSELHIVKLNYYFTRYEKLWIQISHTRGFHTIFTKDILLWLIGKSIKYGISFLTLWPQ